MHEHSIVRTQEKIANLERSQEFHKALGWVALQEIHGHNLVHEPGDVPLPPEPGSYQSDGTMVSNPLELSRPAGPTENNALDGVATSFRLVGLYRTWHANNPHLSGKVVPPALGNAKPIVYESILPTSIPIAGNSVDITPKTFLERRTELKLAKRLAKIKDLQATQNKRSKVYGDTTDHSPLLAWWEKAKSRREDRKLYAQGGLSASEYQANRREMRGITVPHGENIKKVFIVTPEGAAFIGSTIRRHAGTHQEQVTADDIAALTKKAYQGAVKPFAYNRRAKKIEKLQKRQQRLEDEAAAKAADPTA